MQRRVVNLLYIECVYIIFAVYALCVPGLFKVGFRLEALNKMNSKQFYRENNDLV